MSTLVGKLPTPSWVVWIIAEESETRFVKAIGLVLALELHALGMLETDLPVFSYAQVSGRIGLASSKSEAV